MKEQLITALVVAAGVVIGMQLNKVVDKLTTKK